MVGFLITNGGPHPPEKWAVQTASQIIQIGADASGEQAIAGRRLELALLDILEKWHKKIQDDERLELKNKGNARIEEPLIMWRDVDEPLREILDATKGTAFEAHFQKENVIDHIREVLGRDFASVQDIERKWHADRSQ